MASPTVSDATYRGELREINELNFARFEAELERRLGEQTRWFFIPWASLLVTITGLSLRR